jgi:hypothetical protein
MTLNGAATNNVAGNVVRFRYGTATGVYTITTAEQGAAASFTEAVTGLTAVTDYFYVAEILDAAGGTVISTSAECTGTTTAVPLGVFASATDTLGAHSPSIPMGVGNFVYYTLLLDPVGSGNVVTVPLTTGTTNSSDGLISLTIGGEPIWMMSGWFSGSGSSAGVVPITTGTAVGGGNVITVPAAEAAGWGTSPTVSGVILPGRSSLINSNVAGPYTTSSPANPPRNAGGRQIATFSVGSVGTGIAPVVMSSIPAGWQEIPDARYRLLTQGGNTIDMLAFVGPYLLSPSFDTTIDYTAAGGYVGLTVQDIS